MYERLLPPKEPVEFGLIKTKGAFRIERNHNAMNTIITPLPDEPDTEIALNHFARPRRITAIDETGRALREVPFVFTEDAFAKGNPYPLVFTTRQGEFAYRIVW